MAGNGRVTTCDRRRRILDAAEGCFRDEGFHGASMARIAAAADISVGHIYRYFANKEAVVAAIVARDLDESLAAISALPPTVEAQYRVLLDVMREHGKLEHMALWLEVLAEAARNPAVAAMVRAADGQRIDRIADTLASPPGRTLTRKEARERAEFICTLFEGALVRAIRRGCGEPMDLPMLREVLLWSLAGCAGDPRASAQPHEPAQQVGDDGRRAGARQRQA